MSYDRIWLCTSLDWRTWVERYQAEDQDKAADFEAMFDRLYQKGDFVELTHGEEYYFEELYLFESSSDAITFYEEEFKQRQYERPDGSLIGFEVINLYLQGQCRETKGLARTQSNSEGEIPAER